MQYFYIIQLESSLGAQLAFGYEGSDPKTMQRSTYGRVWEACNVMRGKIFVVARAWGWADPALEGAADHR